MNVPASCPDQLLEASMHMQNKECSIMLHLPFLLTCWYVLTSVARVRAKDVSPPAFELFG